MKRGRPKKFNIDWKNPAECRAYERKKYKEKREALGLKYYPRSDRVVENDKRCRRCEELLPIEKFRPLRGHHVGFRSTCRSCENAPRSERKKKLTKWGFSKVKRAALLAAQPYCMLCLSTDDLKLDHCHVTRKVRAVLCGPCNSGLGLFKDDPSLLRAAAEYIEFFKKRNGA